MEKYNSTKSLNFMKCIVNNNDINNEITLHLNSNAHISTTDDTTFRCLNDEINKLLKAKIIDQLTGLRINYTTEEKNMFFKEIQRYVLVK